MHGKVIPYNVAREKYSDLIDECVELRAARLGDLRAKQVERLSDFFCKKTAWLSAPASIKYHNNFQGGLLCHSVAVAETALLLRETLAPEIPKDSVILCGLFHDAGKIYARSNPDGTLVSRYVVNADGTFSYEKDANEVSLTIKDLIIPLRFVDLSDQEIQALLLADGQYTEVNKQTAMKECPLSLIIHYSDLWEGRIVENGVTAEWLSGVMG